MIIPTVKGAPYEVSNMTGAEIEVQSAAGAVLRKVPAMSQFTVYAVDEALVVPDGVEVTAHRFSGAALAVLGGGGTSEPEGIYVCYNADKTDVLSYNLAGLTNGSSMFNKCTALTSFEADLSSLTKGDSMFYKCTSLTSFDSDLSSLTNGSSMFDECTALTSFDSDLSSLTNGNYMFSNCTALTSFDSDLSSLTNGSSMFNRCTALTSFEADLSSLTNGSSMFNICTALTSFDSDLSSLTNGYYMFYNCTALTSFDSDLSSLTNGGGMFHLSKLNKASALRVLSSIPAYTSGTHSLTIGIHVDFKTDEEVLAAISAAESKKWTMTVQWNGTAGTSAASTYSMRGELIYARVVEENGERMLDWGHYVTDETGYETFRSIEAAREYFGIEEE
ncbi:MAG: leucine-rich repeat protein [Akkermansia sp.]|nr:leucine-rich repeat protein [Akkermansia sp.]